MNKLELSPNETVTYRYDAASDRLTIRVAPDAGATRDEPLAGAPGVSLSRDARTGAVVALTVGSVQAFLLQSLVRDVVALARPLLAEAVPAADGAPLFAAPADAEAERQPLGSAPEAIPDLAADAAPAGAMAEEAPSAAPQALPEGAPDVAQLPLGTATEAAEALVEAMGQPIADAPQAEEPPRGRSRRRRSRRGRAAAASDEATAPGEASSTDEVAAPDDASALEEATASEATLADEGVPSDEAAPEPMTVAAESAPSDAAPEPTPTEPAEAQADAEPAPETPAPKRRSRRRKADAEATEAPPVAETNEVPAEPPPAESEAAPETPAAPKRRSRRRKAEPEEPAELTAEGGALDVSAVEAVAEAPTDLAPPAEAAPKRRSRRRKAAEPEAAAPESAEPEPALAEPEPAAAPEGTEAEALAEPDAEEAADEGEASADETPEKSGRRRRRGGRRRRGKGSAAPEAVAEGDEPSVAEAAPAAEGDDEAEDEATDAPEAATGEAEKGGRRKRRRKRKRSASGEAGAATSEAQAERGVSVTPMPASAPTATPPAPQAERRADRSRRDEPGEGEEEPRRSYKTQPIPAMEAPEAFAFMEMHPLLGQAIAAMGFEEPTPIQRRAVPPAMVGQDVVGLAQTGTGKTMAFLIPSLHRLLADPDASHRPRLLVLTPTRELAVQVSEEAEYLATHTELRISVIYGGVGMERQTRELKRGTDVIVATPGRLLDHMRRGNVRLNTVQALVLDEADRMLDMGFLPEIRQVLSSLPTERQTMLFSATMPPTIQSLSLDFQRDPQLVEVARQLPPASIEQRLYPAERHLKTPLLIHLLQSDPAMRSVLAFTETKSEADVLARKLRDAGLPIAVMHGDRNQREREEALQQLRSGAARVLVATNVAARGLDIFDISHVINYDVPQSVDDYVHRIGRTARGEAAGTAYTLVSASDEGMIQRIEAALERQLPRVRAEGFDYDVPTPSWAKPSAEQIIQDLHKPKGLADRFRGMMRRR